MKSVLADLGRGRLYALGLLGALKALGLVLVAGGVASGLASLASHDGGWRTPVIEGLLGALVRGAATWALQVAASRAGASVTRSLRGRMLRRTVGSDGSGATSVGAATTLATTGLDELDRYYTVLLPTLVSAATVPLLVGLRILAADGVSALIVVLTVPLIPVFMVLIGVHTREQVAASSRALERLSDHLVELARGLPVLVGLGRVREQTAALRDISEDWRERSMKTLRTAFLSALALELISTLSVAIVAVFVGVRLVSGTMPLTAGLIALVLAPECFAPFRDIGAAFHSSQTGMEARARVEELLGDAPGGADDAAGAAGANASAAAGAPGAALARRAAAGGALTVEGLTVRHPGRSRDAVTRLSFAAAPGDVVLLDGPSGAGKSTVLAVLAGRGAALSGDAVLTGRITAPLRLAWLPQHPHFAAETASAELAAYAGEATASASALLGLLDDVGLAAAADEDPAQLSPGEQRRLGFARVLARAADDARLLLLDEPTAHLDAANAARVRASITRLAADGAIVVVASHDPLVQASATTRVRLGDADRAARSPRSARGIESVPHGETAADAPVGDARGEIDADRLVDASRTTAPAGRAGEPGGAWRELRRVLAPVRGRMLGAATVGSLAALFAAALTALSGWLIVRAAEHPPILFLEVAIVGVRFFGIGRAALRYSERLLTHDAVFAALTPLRVTLWQGLAAEGPAGRSRLAAANTLDRLIGDGDKVRDLAPRVVVPLISGTLTAVAAIVVLWVFWLPAGLLMLCCVLLALAGGSWLAVAADRRAARTRDLHRSGLLRRVAAVLSARDELAGNGVVDVPLAEIAALDEASGTAARRTAWALGLGSALVVAACSTASIALIALAAPLTVHGPLPIPLAAVFVFTPLALIDPLLETVSAVQRWPELAQVLRRIAPVTEAARAAEVEAEHPGAPVGAVAGLRLEDVAFRYPDAATAVFAHVDAAVAAGERLVVTGPSGAGKTTLLGVLLRYLRPSDGRYLVEGLDAARADAAGLDADALRRRVSWCPQEGHLFASTLRGNLLLARSRDDAPDDAELTAVLAEVGLGPLLDALPDGLDTAIGAEGARLSGGQRQRVAVARTLLARADVVLLDEPTAHLDEEAAEALDADLRRALAGRTTVLVTHRATELGEGDAVLRLGERCLTPADVVPAL